MSPGVASAMLIDQFQRSYSATLDRLLPKESKVVLLDYPTHRNIGDHLIWLGETMYLGRRRDLSVHFISDRFSYSHGSLARHLPRDAIILLHGGGNFGDIYPQVQRMREAILEHFPSNPFIQLPQTVSFSSVTVAKYTGEILRRHPNFTLLARDQRSLELGSEVLSSRVELCVDSAFMLGFQQRTAPAEKPILWIARRDTESLHIATDLPSNVEVFDWDDLEYDARAWTNSYLIRRVWASGLASLRAHNLSIGLLDRRLIHAFDGISSVHAQAGFKQLSRAQVLVTDRLHGHIMAVLLDLPHVLLDNANSKLRYFYDTWTESAACAKWADTPQQALELANAMLQNRSG